MVKYKLIKEYPNSPKIGSIIQNTNPVNGATLDEILDKFKDFMNEA